MDSRVNSGEQNGLRRTSRRTSSADTLRINFRQGLQEIYRANAVPELQLQHIVGAMINLLGISPADHVVGENNRAHFSQCGAKNLVFRTRSRIQAPLVEMPMGH